LKNKEEANKDGTSAQSNDNNKRSSAELLNTEQQFVESKGPNKNQGRKGNKKNRIVDLDSIMPHNLDIEENVANKAEQFQQTTDNRNYAEWAKNSKI